jgi:hypothetical protein
MQNALLTRGDLILLLTDVVEFRELIGDVLSDLADLGVIAFAEDPATGQVVGVQFCLPIYG